MSREKQIKTTDWLIKGISEEELERKKQEAIKEAEAELKQKQIEEMAKVLCIHFGTDKCEDCWNYNMCPASRNAEKFYNEGYLKQEWISVDERLPDDKQTCLAYGTVYYIPDESESGQFFVTKFYRGFGFIENTHAHITHWMPIPEAPNMKGETK